MKAIFLDFDGVLNSDRYIRNCGQDGVIVDPSRMVLLKQIVDATSAKIVLSTSWREHWETDAEKCDETGLLINKIFAEYGLFIFDKTPWLGTEREREIEMWLERRNDVENFVALDDTFLEARFLSGHFVKTSNYKGGLDEDGVTKAIMILNGGAV